MAVPLCSYDLRAVGPLAAEGCCGLLEFRVVGMVLGEALHMLRCRPEVAAVFEDIGGAEARGDAVEVCLVLVGHQHGDAVAAGGVLGGELERWGELVGFHFVLLG